MNRVPALVAAQVAAEAIVNCRGDGYEVETMRAVLTAGEEIGVSDFYLDMLRSTIAAHS